MKLTKMKENKNYFIKSFGNLCAQDIELLNEIGFIQGEIITKNISINSPKNICLFTIDNATFCINKKYIQDIEIKEWRE